MLNRPENLYSAYHAHVYFDTESEAQARQLCISAWEHCHIGLGRFHCRPIGPHPAWSCQLSFDANEFEHVIPWLDANRAGLNILVHPLTGDPLAEHSTHATWLGEAVPLNLEIFSELSG